MTNDLEQCRKASGAEGLHPADAPAFTPEHAREIVLCDQIDGAIADPDESESLSAANPFLLEAYRALVSFSQTFPEQHPPPNTDLVPKERIKELALNISSANGVFRTALLRGHDTEQIERDYQDAVREFNIALDVIYEDSVCTTTTNY